MISRFPVNAPVRLSARGLKAVLNGQPCGGGQSVELLHTAKSLYERQHVGRVVKIGTPGDELEVRFGDRTFLMKDIWLT